MSPRLTFCSIAQTKSAQEKIADDLYEMSKPLARYADDEDLERMLKEREREGDPMLAFIRKKTERVKQNTGENPKKGLSCCISVCIYICMCAFIVFKLGV